jgi:glucan phosphoethanolaminetransferase (alkaline phosphatase superfamily)
MERIVISILIWLSFMAIILWIMPIEKGDRLTKQLKSLSTTFSLGKIFVAFIKCFEDKKNNKSNEDKS